jgi:glycine hydroxymethyltransferase
MVPFDDKSPFVTSGIRVGTAAITTRGMKEKQMDLIVELLDAVITDPENEPSLRKIRKRVHRLMESYPLYRHKGLE